MTPIRVLVVDRSPVVRRLLCRVVDGDAALRVAAVAGDARTAVHLAAAVRPDAVTLDCEAHDLAGPATLAALCRLAPEMAVILFGSAAADDDNRRAAVSGGAADYLVKPIWAGGIRGAYEQLRRQLPSAIKRTVHRRRQKPALASLA